MAAMSDQTGAGLAETIDRIRWRLWHGQGARALDLIGETLVTLDDVANAEGVAAVAARKVASVARSREIHLWTMRYHHRLRDSSARGRAPISTAITESTVQWLLHRRMNAQQHMRWSPRGAHLMPVLARASGIPTPRAVCAPCLLPL
jgi:hypothetical protein